MRLDHLFLASLFVVSQLAGAATITVDSLADESNVNGACSLREAINAANSNTSQDCEAGDAGADEINFVEGLAGVITFVDSQPLTVTEDLTIVGPGADSLTVDAAGRARVFEVSQPGGGTFVISAIGVRGGDGVDHGGGILIDGGIESVTVDGVVFDTNSAGGRGGAIAVLAGTDLDLTVRNSEFTDNEAVLGGGAIYQGVDASGSSVQALVSQNRFRRNLNPRSTASVEMNCDVAPCFLDVDTNSMVNHQGRAAALVATATSGDNNVYFRNNEVHRDVSDTAGRSNNPGGTLLNAAGGNAYAYNNVFLNHEAELGGALSLEGNNPSQRIIVAFNSFWQGACIDVESETCATTVFVTNATAVLYGNYFYEEFDGATCGASQAGTGTIVSEGYNLAQFPENTCVDVDGTTDRVASGSTRPGAGGSMSFFELFRGPTARTDEVADIMPAPCGYPAVDAAAPLIPLDHDYTGQVRPVDHDGDGTADCDAGATELSPLLQSVQLGSGDGDLFINGDFGFGNIFTWDTEANVPAGGLYSEVLGGSLRISARPDPGNLFVGFSEGCDGIRTNFNFTICEVINDEAKTIEATFEPEGSVYELSVSVAGDGSGIITSTPAGIDCGLTCSDFFEADSTVSLTFEPLNGSSFLRWEGDCTGSGVCQLSMTGTRTVTAVFTNPDIIFAADFENANDNR